MSLRRKKHSQKHRVNAAKVSYALDKSVVDGVILLLNL
jgi:hypothetical protein